MTYIFFPGDQLSIIHLLFHKPGFQKKSHFLKVMQDLLQRKRTCMHRYLRKPSGFPPKSFFLSREWNPETRRNYREAEPAWSSPFGGNTRLRLEWILPGREPGPGFPGGGQGPSSPPTALPGGTCLAAELWGLTRANRPFPLKSQDATFGSSAWEFPVSSSQKRQGTGGSAGSVEARRGRAAAWRGEAKPTFFLSAQVFLSAAQAPCRGWWRIRKVFVSLLPLGQAHWGRR